jgi:hypothetical protein
MGEVAADADTFVLESLAERVGLASG